MVNGRRPVLLGARRGWWDKAGARLDFDFETAAWVVAQADAGEPITALAGVHPGCYELFAHEPVRTISDLKGKRVGIEYPGSSGTCSWRS